MSPHVGWLDDSQTWCATTMERARRGAGSERRAMPGTYALAELPVLQPADAVVHEVERLRLERVVRAARRVINLHAPS